MAPAGVSLLAAVVASRKALAWQSLPNTRPGEGDFKVIQGNHLCWVGWYDFNKCCDPSFGPRGSPQCFQKGVSQSKDKTFTYEYCCQRFYHPVKERQELTSIAHILLASFGQHGEFGNFWEGSMFPDYDCRRVNSPSVDWNSYASMTIDWWKARLDKPSAVQGMQWALMEFAQDVAHAPSDGTLKDCPIGLLFTLIFVLNLLLANDETKEVGRLGNLAQGLMHAIPLHSMAFSRWPTFQLLDDLHGAKSMTLPRKNLMEFSHLPLDGSEHVLLAGAKMILYERAKHPAASFARVAQGVLRRTRGAWSESVTLLVRGASYAVREVSKELRRKSISPSARRSSRHCLVLTVLQTKSEGLLSRFVSGLRALGQEGAEGLLVAAADTDAEAACLALLAHPRCIRAAGLSVLPKYAFLSILLALGIDVVYLGADTIPRLPPTQLRTPTYRLGNKAASCVETSTFWAPARSAHMLLSFLRYLYQHPYELESVALAKFFQLKHLPGGNRSFSLNDCPVVPGWSWGG